MRHDESDEADRSTQCDGGAREDTTGDVSLEQGAFHVGAASCRPIFSDGKQVPLRRVADDRDTCYYDDNTVRSERGPLDGVEATDEPARDRERLREPSKTVSE